MESNPECIIDTNPIINIINYSGIMDKFNETIDLRQIKIVVCDQVFKELSKPQPFRWPGLDRLQAKEALSELFGDSLQEYSETGNKNIELEEKRLREQYKSNNLHYPDSILLAILKIKSWDKIITNDNDLINCCKAEKIEIVLNPKPHADLKAYGRGLEAVVENGISNDELTIRIKDLSLRWKLVKNNDAIKYNMSKDIFFKLFKKTTFQLGKTNPRFAAMNKRLDNEPNLISSFLEKILPDSSYEWIMLTLDSVLKSSQRRYLQK